MPVGVGHRSVKRDQTPDPGSRSRFASTVKYRAARMASASPSIDVRALRPSDLGALVSWHRTADELLQWTGRRFQFPLDKRQLTEYAATAGEFRHLICAVAPDTGAMLGHAELEVIPEHDLGRIHAVVVAPELRGRGIAGALVDWLVAFAFDDLVLHRLELVTLSFNEPALRCYRRAGFTQEGLARHACKASDGYWDLVNMGLLASGRPRRP
jgi:RimJ/RimL family protein N-acetyltransferase